MTLPLWAAPLIFLGGIIFGRIYSRYWEDTVVRYFARFHAWSESRKVPAFSWGTVLLAIAVIVVAVSYWVDHERWNGYLDCQSELAAAQLARSGPTAQRDAAQVTANLRQQDLNSLFNDIGQTIPLDGAPPTPEEQEAATAAYVRLKPVSHAAEVAYRDLNQLEVVLAEVRKENPLPDCGPSPS